MAATPTQRAVEIVRLGWDVPECRLVGLIIEELVKEYETGVLDSYPLARAFLEIRGEGADSTQTKDYVQYMIRENDGYVCRHALNHEHTYRFHREKECSETCRRKWGRTAETRRVLREFSPCCNVEVTTAGSCPLCE